MEGAIENVMLPHSSPLFLYTKLHMGGWVCDLGINVKSPMYKCEIVS